MTDLPLARLDQFRDTIGLWRYHVERDVLGRNEADALAKAADYSRDKLRTPMQWAPGPGAGFCPPGVAPWLPINPNANSGVNVAEQDADSASLLNFYRRLLAVRRATPALQLGEYEPIDRVPDQVLAFARRLRAPEAQGGGDCLVAMNRSDRPVRLRRGSLPALGRVLFGAVDLLPKTVRLPPFGLVIIELR
jgi:alpha-glucosidase